MPAKFVLKKGPTGKFRFSLHASNGQVIATSEAYETKAKALAGIASVRKNADGATLVDDTVAAAKAAPAKTAAKVAKAPAKAAKAVKAAADTAAKAPAKAAKAAKAVKKAARTSK